MDNVKGINETRLQTTTTPGIKSPGMWLSFLLGRVSVLGQESEQVGVVLAGQDALSIQGIIADNASEGGCGRVFRICADGFPDGVGRGLAAADPVTDPSILSVRHATQVPFYRKST
ncbi:MAG: hypothetical protein IJJ45_06990 [Clostridia bacterium]|nr:hypothetical protein [Clostridia bacterium]